MMFEQQNSNYNPAQGKNAGGTDVRFGAQSYPRNGEYSFRGGFEKDNIYTDAHYTPAGQSTVPPRYYTPPQRAEKPRRTEKSGRAGRFIRTICLCLICAMLGGFIGASFMGGSLSKRVSELEESYSQSLAEDPSKVIPESSEPTVAEPASSGNAGETLSPAEIYELACRQVVGITTEVTFTNYFGMSSSSAVSGSGFIVSEDGYIITNYHVIEYAAQNGKDATVILNDGSRYNAAIVGYEKYNDVAVIKIDASGLTPVVFGDSEKLSVGDEVFAVGNPLGELDFTMSFGHVSALNRLITTDESGVAINMFQIDAAVNSGNSGGPVYDSQGRVIGIVTAKYADAGVEGLGFAIPINDAVGIAGELITKGYVSGKAYMGVSIDQGYNSMYSQYYNMPLGAYVNSVEVGSCAEKAGIEPGDIIVRLGTAEISGYTDLITALHGYSAGDTVELAVYRGGETIVLTITFDEAKN